MLAVALLLQETIQEYDRRAREVYDQAVVAHARQAKALKTRGLYRWAREEYAKVLHLQPDHEVARRDLGYEREGGAWVATDGGMPRSDKAQEDLEEQAAKHLKELDRAAAGLAKEHLTLAAWCAENGLAELAREHRLEAHALDPTDPKVAEALGFTKSALLPVASSPDAVALFDAFRSDREKAALGEIKEAKDGYGEAGAPEGFRVAHGARVGIESTYMDETMLRELCRWGDHMFAASHALLGVEAPKKERRYWFVFAEREGYEAVTKWLQGDGWESWMDTSSYHNNVRAYRVSQKREDEIPSHVMAHQVAQFVVRRRLDKVPENKAAIVEGFAILGEFLGAGTNRIWCYRGEGTGDSGGGRKNYREEAAALARGMEEMPVVELFGSTLDTLKGKGGSPAAKAASVVEWLFARDPAAARAFFTELAGEEAKAATLIAGHFGWTPYEFEEYWRRWAMAVGR
ncbi:MAG: hypothetical protein A3F84_15855 [Candidatus Handelsmanbacteria bacterium RIFCSPLOWO2_12_FULL_64_10]|uniref:Tetratricopeptide repeat protein n=1 Tax=Handelsmanbacteria sp. (strain RIFCSPLOWO2_12_FULL_64_10) TaxID=1817868 RepID=A0A1F6D3P7_HANXR|nr:MAG: hypothetical protein A3F84_15855 [Candidatus Handelsmanbacteria bacterium RIFCSPLOWO2_12_FULL_64_10]